MAVPALLGALLLLNACTSRTLAPVEDAAAPPPPSSRELPPPPRESPDTYLVKRGDSLYAIAFDHGMDYRDLAAWNDIGPPYTIYPDQRLRLKPPPEGERGLTQRRAAPHRSVEMPRLPPATESVDPPPPASASRPPPRREELPRSRTDLPVATPEPEARTSSRPSPAVTGTSQPATRSAADDAWQWPAAARVVRQFDPGQEGRKGMVLAGRPGQAVLAARGGEVVYSGSGLIGYGELIIIKHDERFLSAYGHNQRRLVEEGDRVYGGQQIGEFGRNERGEIVLHFEIREHGKPVDPRRYLPSS